jgi:hypothetical protein
MKNDKKVTIGHSFMKIQPGMYEEYFFTKNEKYYEKSLDELPI